MIRKLGWSSMTLLALLVAAYAAGALISPALRPAFVQNLLIVSPFAIVAHIAGGATAIVLGAFQLNARLRTRFLPAHRWLGRTYVVAVCAGGIAGFILALSSTGGLVTHFGFGLMAICWVSSTLNAYRHIRAGDVLLHRAWMLRSYALTLAAVTLRIYLPLSAVNGIEFEAAYQAISWLCWVPNLLIVEWFVLPRLLRTPAPA